MSKKNPSPLDNIKSELNKRPSTILDKEKKLTIEAQSKQTICLYRDGKEILARSFKPNFWTASAGALDGFSQDMKLLGIYNTKAEGRAALLCVTSELKNTFSSWLASNDTKSEVALEKITTSFYERKGQLYEEIYSDGFAKFVTLRNGEIIIVDEIDGIKPILDEAVRQKAVLLPTEAKPYKDTKSLLQEIQTFIHKWVDVSPKYEVIASWYILFSWVYDVLHTTPYLRALGDTGSGKTRFLDTIGRLCYKATAISGAVTPAPIYRLLTKWHGTLLVDEADFQDSSYYSEVITIFNCGFQRGRPVIRCNKDNPDDVEFFDAFGPKVIATRQRFKDKA